MKNPPAIMPLLMKLRCCCEDNQREACDLVGLSMSEFAGLSALETGEKIAGAELAARVRLSPSRCSRVIDRMVDRGLVSREQCPNDRRAIRVSLTTQGAKLKRNLGDQMAACERKILAKLTADQIRDVVRCLNILLEATHGESDESAETK